MGLIIAWVLVGVLTLTVGIMFYAIKNLLSKNERLEDFFISQSEIIEASNNRLAEIDERGIFRSDDEIGWFFEQVLALQKALDNFRLR
jgi:hypothetical protein